MKRKLLLIPLSVIATAHADPILTSWYTKNSSVLARVIQTTNTSTGTKNTTPVTTWPTTGITNNNTNTAAQSTPVYADVQRIRYTTTDVYINSSGLASYTMGPWLTNAGGLFGFWPVSQNFVAQITRTPSAPSVKVTHQGGVIGMMVNGVGIYDLGDAFGFVQTISSPVAGSDSMGNTNVTHPWWRDALAVEVVTFDPGFAHQPGSNGQYHYHAEPKALRYQLGDNMMATYSGTPNNTYVYTEDSSNLHHSPILGWCFDGYPIYGPYAYSDPTNSASPVTRMRSGFVKRDGSNGTTNIISTGRTTLPKWATIAENLLTAATYVGTGSAYTNGDFILGATLQGPVTTYSTTGPGGTTTYSLGRYIGDYDFLGDRGFLQTTGVTVRDFDLDQYNGRTCKTPEFPGGTYAYFVTIDASGNPAFPYMLGKQYYGTKNGTTQNVTVPGTGVTELFNTGGTNLVETIKSAPSVNSSTGDVTLTWSSVEGGIYTVQASDNLSAWTTLSAAMPAPVNTVLPAPNNVITTTSITDSGVALPANHPNRFYRVTRNP
ncbi:MAG: YHYH protein [Luteolibacter sp.]